MTVPSSGRTTVSVALATYNGERYLPEQLASIAAQTRGPDEIVIGDDGSTDGTEALVQAFAAAHPAIEVHFTANPQRLGSSGNFEAIVSRCRGDVVVFSDQDDRWLPQRVERSLAALDADPAALLVFGNGTLIDGEGGPLDGTLFDSVDFAPAERACFQRGEAFDVLLRRNVVTGAAMAVRRTALERARPFGAGWIHDYWLALLCAAWGRVVLLDAPVIAYRLHAAQQVGVARGSGAALMRYARKQSEAHVRAEAAQWQALALRLADVPALQRPLQAKIDFLQRRAGLRARPLVAPWNLLRLLAGGGYARFSLGLKQAVVDLVAAGLAATGR